MSRLENNHWCPTYRALQQEISTIETSAGLIPSDQKPVQTVRGWETPWEPHVPVWYPNRIENEQIVGAKKNLYAHRTSCDRCIVHFSQR